MRHSERLWMLAGSAGALAAAIIASKMIDEGWRRYSGEPPMNPEMRGVSWKQALLWGALTGSVVGVARVGGRRMASGAATNLRRRRRRPKWKTPLPGRVS